MLSVRAAMWEISTAGAEDAMVGGVVVLGVPDALVAQAFDVLGEGHGVRERLAQRLVLPHGGEVDDGQGQGHGRTFPDESLLWK